jgi:hypothetical protein
VQKRYRDCQIATFRAIIVHFHTAHGTTNKEVLYLRPDWKKVFGILVESLSAEWAGYPGYTLSANPSRVHHPQNSEFLGAIDTPGNKLIGHEALFPRTSFEARSRTAAAQEAVALFDVGVFRLA